MRRPVRFVCAFSDVPHHGNPAAVVLLDDLLEEARMQAIAAELAQPITAFVAGAGVHVLAESDRGRERVLCLEHRAGTLTAHVTDRGYALDLPVSAVVTYR